MSQYRTIINDKMYMYGYDRPLQEYFFACFNTKAGDDDEGVLFSISSHCTLAPHPDYPGKLNWSNGELIDIVKKEMGDNAPEEFLNAMALDLPL